MEWPSADDGRDARGVSPRPRRRRLWLRVVLRVRHERCARSVLFFHHHAGPGLRPARFRFDRPDAPRRLATTPTDAPPTLPSVPRAQVVFGGTHLGRDITTRMSRQWRGRSVDENDDRGRPPYRTPRAMDEEAEEEFVWQWCDHYLGKAGLDGVVAYLSEYAEQAEREEAAEDGGA